MKLIYVANVRFPTEKAHGYQIAKMCEVFASKGLSLKLIVPTRKNNITEDPFDFYGLERNFRVTYIPTPDLINISPLFLRKWGFFLQSFFYLIRLFFLKINREAIIYSRDPGIVFLFSKRGFKVVFESHRFPDSKIWLHEYFIKKADKIVTVTSSLGKLYRESGFGNPDILVASDGVDMSLFDINISKEEARRVLGLSADAFLLGYTGHLQTMGMEKGFSEIMDALRVILKNNNYGKQIFFVSVGGGKKDLPSDIKDNLIMIERVERTKLAIYQKAFDILLMPFPKTTHYEYFMSPMKMFEYMAARRPIVASDLPSVREVLNESNAVLVKPDDPESLACGIKKVLEDTEFAEKIAKQAYQDSHKYTWEKRAGTILRFLK